MTYDDLINDIIPDCPGVPVPVAIRAIRESVRKFCRESTAYRKKLATSDLSYANGVYTIAIPDGTQIESVISPISLSIGADHVVYTYSNGVLSYNSVDSSTPLPGFSLTGNAVSSALSYTVYTYSNGVNTYNSIDSSPIVGYALVSSIQVDSSNLKTKEAQGASPEWMDKRYPGWRGMSSTSEVKYFVMLSANTFVLTPDSGTDRKSNMAVSLVLMPDRVTSTIDDEFGNRWFDELTAGAKALLMVMPKTDWSDPQMASFYGNKFLSGIEDAKCYAASGFRHPRTADGKGHVRSYFK